MTRPLRINLEGGVYHVSARGNERKAIFRDDEDRRHFLELLGQSVERFAWLLQGYVLLENHYHLLVETPRGNLTGGMQWLNVSYSMGFNRRHHRVGHLFQGRFKAVLVDWEHWGLEVSRYLHLNPIRVKLLGLGKEEQARWRAGVGREASREVIRARLQNLREYPWSSYRAYLGKSPCPAWLTCERVFGFFPGKSPERRRHYQRFVEGAVRAGEAVEIWKELKGQVLLGEEEFLEGVRQYLQGDEREQPDLVRLRRRVSWEQVVAAVEEVKGEGWEQFRDRRKDWGRDLAFWLAQRHAGMTLKGLAERGGGLDYTTVGYGIKQIERQRLADPRLRKALSQAEALLRT